MPTNPPISALNSDCDASASPGSPLISVVIPYRDSRRHPDHVSDWTRRQTFAEEQFEVILVAHREDRDLAAVQTQLRDRDRLLLSDSCETFAMYAEGAAVARGELLLFSEDHVRAEPECLAIVERHFRTTQDAGATIQWGHINRTAVARMEARLSEIDAQALLEGEHWNRVRIRGFAIRRSVYEAVGGFEPEFGGFAEALLSAKLHAAGRRIGLTAERGIRHINTYYLREIRENVADYTAGECAYFAHGDADFCDRYFGASGILFEAADQAEGVTLSALIRAVRATKRAGALQRGDPFKILCEFGRSAASGLRRRWGPRLAMIASRLRFYLASFDPDRQRAALHDYWRAVVGATRAAYYAGRPTCGGRAIRLADHPCSVTSAEALPSPNLVETFAGNRFRWLAPLTTLRFPLPSGEYALVIDTLGVRGDVTGISACFLWNGRPFDEGRLRFQGNRISLDVRVEPSDDDQEQTLTILAPALQGLRAAETRRLGLPVSSLSIVSPSEAIEAIDQPATGVNRRDPAPETLGSATKSRRTSPAGDTRKSAVFGTYPRSDQPNPLRITSVNTADLGGGAERMAWSLFKGFENRGHESWLAVGAKATNDDRVVPFFASPFIDYRRESSWGTRLRQKLAQRFNRWTGRENFSHLYTGLLPRLVGEAPDAILCHNLHGGYFDLRLIAGFSRQIPTFAVLHDMWLMTGHCAHSQSCPRWETGCGRCPDLTLPPAVARDATRDNWLNKASILAETRLHVIAPSRWMLERAERSILKPGIVEARVIPNGVDLQTFRPGPRAEARSQLPLPTEGRLAVFAGNHPVSNPYKDYATVRAAFVRLAERQPLTPLHLAVVGEAGEPQRLGSLTIHHVPFTSQELLGRFYRAADVYVHAAKLETFGLVLAEAMACGTPVVATDVGGISEVVRAGRDGLLVPPGDPAAFATAVQSLINDDSRRRAMSEHALAHARTDFDEETMIDRYLAWIDEVLQSATVGGETPARLRRAA